MVSIKTFNDGDRLVVVFEGLKDLPAEERLIKTFLGGIVQTTGEKIPDVSAKPVKQDTKMPEIPKEVFQGAKYAGFEGMTPEEVIANGRNKGFRFLTDCLEDDVDLSDNLRVDIELAVNKYLDNFRNCDADGYSKKLSESQLNTFLYTYARIMPEDARRLPDDDTSRRTAVRLTIEHININN